MTNAQKIELRRSEIRSRLGEIAGLEGAAVTAEIGTERDTLLTELAASEPQLRAAIESDQTEARQRGDQAAGDGEDAERASLVQRATLSAFVGEARSQLPISSGPEAELRAAVFGAASRPGVTPWEVLLPRGVERRADAATGVADNAGATGHPVLARLFATSATAFLGVNLVSVERGVSSHPVLSAGVSPAMAVKGAAKDAEAATVLITSLPPVRLTARYLASIEDFARIDSLEDALRADLVAALAEKMDQQVIAGDGAAPNVEGIQDAVAAAAAPAAVSAFPDFVGISANAVDGIGAGSSRQIRLLVDLKTYRGASKTFADGVSGSDYLSMNSAGLRTSPHLVSSDAKLGETLCYRTMAPGSAIATIWSGFEMIIRDDLSGAASGQVALTAVMLWNFKTLRAAGYQRGKVRFTL